MKPQWEPFIQWEAIQRQAFRYATKAVIEPVTKPQQHPFDQRWATQRRAFQCAMKTATEPLVKQLKNSLQSSKWQPPSTTKVVTPFSLKNKLESSTKTSITSTRMIPKSPLNLLLIQQRRRWRSLSIRRQNQQRRSNKDCCPFSSEGVQNHCLASSEEAQGLLSNLCQETPWFVIHSLIRVSDNCHSNPDQRCLRNVHH